MSDAEPMKYCRLCDELRPVSEFYPWRLGADGLDSLCKTHRKATTKAYRATQRGHMTQYALNKINRNAAGVRLYQQIKSGYQSAADQALRDLGIGVPSEQEDK